MPRSHWAGPGTAGRGNGAGRRRALAALAAAALALAGCDSQGLYETPTEPGQPGTPTPPGTGRGQLVNIPGVGLIADMVVDPASQQVFLSNFGQHRIEVLRPDTLLFGASVPVGSQPWGLSLSWNRAAGAVGDTLIVANSGGTNVSFVSTAERVEHVARRFDIPRITLYEIDFTVEGGDTVPGTGRVTGGDTVYTDIRFFNYADRPQHVAQDSRGRLVYSAISTQAAPIGSVRIADWQPGYQQWNARYLFHERSLVAADGTFAIANADSVVVVGNAVVIHDHVPGTRPRQHLVSPVLRVEDAVANIRGRGGDVELYVNARWRLPESVALADTTYVAASADRDWVVIGEGARDRASRVIMWTAAGGRSSLVEDIADIVNNTSDFVHGVELNANGSLGVARGSQGTYFFGNDLRLQGLAAGSAAGGQGAAFLPGAGTNRTHAFEPTGNGTVRVIETTHYTVVSEIAVREAVAGPFRVGPPRQGVQACPPNLTEGDPNCVAATAYGVTTSRRLLVLDIRQNDIVR